MSKKNKTPSLVIVILCVLLSCSIALTDYATGTEISLSLFFLAPVAIASWWGSLGLGLVFALLDALLWAGANYLGGMQVSSEWVWIWNSSVRLGFFVIVVLLLARLRSSLEKVTQLSQHDGLTGLLNRRAFWERYALEWNRSKRSGGSLVLMLCDLDNFKQVNDKEGHTLGDQVLIGFAQAVQEQLRAQDTAARFGGDEFIILLSDPDVQDPGSAARKAVQRIHEQGSSSARAVCASTGVSMGAILFSPQTDFDPEAGTLMIQNADQLLYTAKKSGKNSYLLEESKLVQVSPEESSV